MASAERLSDHVYQYDSTFHELVRCDHAEERKLAEKRGFEEWKSRESLKARLAEKKAEVKAADVNVST